MWSQFLSNPLPEHIEPTHPAFYRTRHLGRNAELGISFHVLQEHLLAAAVIQFRGPAVGMAGDSLSSLKGAVIFQKIRDAGCPERVRRIMRRPTGLFYSQLSHVPGARPDEA